MKKIILFVLSFLMILAIISYTIIPQDEVVGVSRFYTRANGVFKEEKNSLDVLFLGNSEMYSSISPLDLWDGYKITSYNCGTSGQKLNDTYEYFRKGLKYQNVKAVVVEVDNFFKKVEFEDIFSTDLGNILPIFRYHNQWKQIGKRKEKYRVSRDTRLKGYFFNNNIGKVKFYRNYFKKTKLLREITFYNKEFIDAMVKECKKRNIKLIFTSMPTLKSWTYKKHNTVKAYCKKNNITFIDFNKNNIANINWDEDSRDQGDHLNYTGAMKTTLYMGDYLSKIIKKDNHSNVAKKWNEDYKYYQNLINNIKLKNENPESFLKSLHK